MPKHDQLKYSLSQINNSFFSKQVQNLNFYEGEKFPLHVGNVSHPDHIRTNLQNSNDFLFSEKSLEYGPPEGIEVLHDAIIGKIKKYTNETISRNNIIVTPGGTGAVAFGMGSVIEKGDEVIIFAPFWPLIVGIIHSFEGIPVIIDSLNFDNLEENYLSALQNAISPKTVAIYLNSPCNPTGNILPKNVLSVIVKWARKNNLWLISDEAYEDYVFEGKITYCRELAPERTFSAYSFSKSYGVPGIRCGYLIGPQKSINHAKKINTHLGYGASIPSQIIAASLIKNAMPDWKKTILKHYEKVCIESSKFLGLNRPHGAIYLFFQIKNLDNMKKFLENCLKNGLLVTPGSIFGPYPDFIRVCFSSLSPDKTYKGLEKLNQILNRHSRT